MSKTELVEALRSLSREDLVQIFEEALGDRAGDILDEICLKKDYAPRGSRLIENESPLLEYDEEGNYILAK